MTTEKRKISLTAREPAKLAIPLATMEKARAGVSKKNGNQWKTGTLAGLASSYLFVKHKENYSQGTLEFCKVNKKKGNSNLNGVEKKKGEEESPQGPNGITSL